MSVNGGGSRHQGRATRRGGGGGGGGGSVSAPRGGDGQPPPGEAAHVSATHACARMDLGWILRWIRARGCGGGYGTGDPSRRCEEGMARGKIGGTDGTARDGGRDDRGSDVCRDSCACARAPRAVLSFLCMSARSTRSGARVDIDIRSQRSARADSSGYTSRSGQLSSVSAGSVQHDTKASQTTSTEGDQSGGRIGLVSLGVHGAVAPPIAQPRPACSFRALMLIGASSDRAFADRRQLTAVPCNVQIASYETCALCPLYF